MTRLMHVFRHLSAAAKKQSYNTEAWRVFRKISDSEEASARKERIAMLKSMEKKLRLLKKVHGDNKKLLAIEERISSLKNQL